MTIAISIDDTELYLESGSFPKKILVIVITIS